LGGVAIGRDFTSSKVAADKAYQNARKNSDKQNAKIEHDKALKRVMTAVLKDDSELYKQFSDNTDFRRWLTDMVFSMTYEGVG
jgi:type I restriction enzyme R subunit